MSNTASSPHPSNRVLRVGLVHEGRLIEERLLRKPQAVTVGRSSGNTFVLPEAPKRQLVVDERSGSYALVFDAYAEGRVMVAGAPRGLDELVRSGEARRRGDRFLVPLEPTARGKVSIAGYTLLFQFIDAPAVLAPLRLPAAARRTLLPRGSERGLVSALIVCGIVLGGGGVGLDAWWRVTGQYMEQGFERKPLTAWLETEAHVSRVEFVRPVEDDPQPKVTQPDVDPVELTPTEQPTEVADANPTPKEAPERVAKESTADSSTSTTRKTTRSKPDDRVAKQKDKTWIHTVSSKGDSSDPFASLMQGVSDSKLAAAFSDPTTGVADATADSAATFRGEPTAVKSSSNAIKRLSKEEASPSRIATKPPKSGPKNTADKPDEIAIRGNVKSGSVIGAAGVGGIDKSAVSSVFNRRRRAVRSCYEAALRRNESAAGKVTVRFTIGTAGRITSIKIATNTTGDSKVGQCITDKVKSWKFPQPDGGPVTFSFPFVLSKG